MTFQLPTTGISQTPLKYLTICTPKYLMENELYNTFLRVGNSEQTQKNSILGYNLGLLTTLCLIAPAAPTNINILERVYAIMLYTKLPMA
jgi:hypothetical protein